MTLRETVYSKLHAILEDLVDLACDNIESLGKLDVPDVLKCLYPSDVLNALADNGIINFNREER